MRQPNNRLRPDIAIAAIAKRDWAICSEHGSFSSTVTSDSLRVSGRCHNRNLGIAAAPALTQGANDDPITQNWSPSEWGADDKAGSVNRITPDKVLKAVKFVKQDKTAFLGKVYAQDPQCRSLSRRLRSGLRDPEQKEKEPVGEG
jgi:hypothetical protein